MEAENLCSCGFLISDDQYMYNDAGLITNETAKECLFASNKDFGHKGGPDGECVHVSDNPWQNQNPEWQTTKRTFRYDDNGQLIECKEDKGMFDKTTYTYEYDSVGNRTMAKKQKAFTYANPDKTTYTYNADNQMVSAVVCEGNLTKRYTYKYDANGNLTQECLMNYAETTYQYDTENRLKAVKDGQKLLMAAAYDGDGNRTFQLNYNPEAECGYGKNVSGEIFMPENHENEDGSLTAEGDLFSYICSATGRAYDLTEYVNDTNRQYTEVLTAYTVNSGATESYSYKGRQRLSRNNIWTEARDLVCNETSYYLYDGRGSVTANTWYNGMVTSVYKYDPYGQVTLGSTEHTDFYGYNAESYNPNTGLEYLRARYYNTNKGRFFQEDTYLGDIADPLTLNRYAYTKNSPLNYIDPSGNTTYGGGLKQSTSTEKDYFAAVNKLQKTFADHQRENSLFPTTKLNLADIGIDTNKSPSIKYNLKTKAAVKESKKDKKTSISRTVPASNYLYGGGDNTINASSYAAALQNQKVRTNTIIEEQAYRNATGSYVNRATDNAEVKTTATSCDVTNSYKKWGDEKRTSGGRYSYDAATVEIAFGANYKLPGISRDAKYGKDGLSGEKDIRFLDLGVYGEYNTVRAGNDFLVGSSEFGLDGSLGVKALSAEGRAEIKVAPDGVSAEAKGLASVISGDSSIGFVLLGLSFGGTIEGHAGAIGGEAAFKFGGDGVKVKAGAAALLGVSVGLEIKKVDP